MIKKIKKWYKLQKMIQLELIETLCTICLYIESDNYHRNPYSRFMGGHFKRLKHFSDIIREELKEDE